MCELANAAAISLRMFLFGRISKEDCSVRPMEGSTPKALMLANGITVGLTEGSVV